MAAAPSTPHRVEMISNGHATIYSPLRKSTGPSSSSPSLPEPPKGLTMTAPPPSYRSRAEEIVAEAERQAQMYGSLLQTPPQPRTPAPSSSSSSSNGGSRALSPGAERLLEDAEQRARLDAAAEKPVLSYGLAPIPELPNETATAANLGSLTTEEAALKISLDKLDQTTAGRRTEFETRLMMQRELEGARDQLRATTTLKDEVRRELHKSREECAEYKAQLSITKEELQLLKKKVVAFEELKGAFDIKEKLTMNLQAELTNVKEELANKTALSTYLQEHTNELDAELNANRETYIAAETDLTSRLENAQVEIVKLNKECVELQDRATKAEEDLRDRVTVLADYKEALEKAAQEKVLLDDRVEAQHIEILQLRAQLATQKEELSALKASSTTMRERAVVSDARINELTSENARLAHENRGNGLHIATLKEKEKQLASDLRHLHRYVGAREIEVVDLAKALEEKDRTLDRMSPLLSATKTHAQLLQLEREREEADRLETLIKHRENLLNLERSRSDF